MRKLMVVVVDADRLPGFKDTNFVTSPSEICFVCY